MSISTCFFAHGEESLPERINVTTQQTNQFLRLEDISSTLTLNNTQSAPAKHVADFLTQLPEVSLSGQGGQFQVVSIRGFSRWRLTTQVEGIPIFSDRRAGTSAEFLAPEFISHANVATGAASTFTGSGAIGGGINLVLQQPNVRSVSTSLSAINSGRSLTYLDHKGRHQWALSTRTESNGEDADGTLLFDQFEQHSGFWRGQYESGPLKESFILFSEGNNIGKSTSDFPNSRVTLYPTNDHWLGKFSFDLLAGELDLYWHKSRLDTEIERVNSRQNIIRNDAFDYGLNYRQNYFLHDWQGQWKLDINGRADVSAQEREQSANNQVIFDRTILDGDQIELGLGTDVGNTFGRLNLAVGSRFAWLQQNNLDTRRTDLNLSGFVGTQYELAPNWAVSTYLSSAYRTPNLTERFFDGQTPRGQTLGDPNLSTERATNYQAGIHYNTGHVTGRVTAFYQQINNYIERLEIDDRLLLYRNLDRAKIKGTSYQLTWLINHTELNWSGQWLDGEDNAGNSIADITPNEHRFKVQQSFNHANVFVETIYRQSKSDVSSSEQPLPSVVLINAGLNVRVSNKWNVSLNLTNLTNKRYLTTTDDRAPFATKRDLMLKTTYQF